MDKLSMVDRQEFNRLFWHSRRGMLELDLILLPFLKQCYEDLSSEDQATYKTLLAAEDQDLFQWFLGRGKPDDQQLALMVDMIMQHAQTPQN